MRRDVEEVKRRASGFVVGAEKLPLTQVVHYLAEQTSKFCQAANDKSVRATVDERALARIAELFEVEAQPENDGIIGPWGHLPEVVQDAVEERQGALSEANDRIRLLSGQLLRWRRVALGLSQREVCDGTRHFRVQPARLGEIERGTHGPIRPARAGRHRSGARLVRRRRAVRRAPCA